MDDLLDYTGDATVIGKNLGDDLAEGKMTLPLIRALAMGTEADNHLIHHAIEGGGLDDFAPLIEILTRTGALRYTEQRAREEAVLAAACLEHEPASRQRESLLQLCAFAVERSY